MLGYFLMSLCLATVFVGPLFLFRLYLDMLPGQKKKREMAIDRAMDKAISDGKLVCRVTAVLKRKTRVYRDSFNEYSRNYVYEYSYKGRSYRYRLWMRRNMPQTLTLYFLEERPRRVKSDERELFARGKGGWLAAWLLLAALIFLVMTAA